MTGKILNRKVFLLFIFLQIILNTINCSAYSGENISNKKVYLTFDDGPIPCITEKLLLVLKDNNVKATFFVVGKEIIGREDLLIKIKENGHSLGLHTYSHNFKKIYSSENAFVDEMLKTQSLIEEISGTKPEILRFPGGSSRHLTTSLYNKLHENNLKVYDWNIDLLDGINGELPPHIIIKNGEKFKDDFNRIIILAHCNSNNNNTIKALPEIISFYRSKGYEFCPITKDTDEYYYRIKK